jgi:hypothetical protein
MILYFKNIFEKKFKFFYFKLIFLYFEIVLRYLFKENLKYIILIYFKKLLVF